MQGRERVTNITPNIIGRRDYYHSLRHFHEPNFMGRMQQQVALTNTS
jgi:hypothetical protein